MKLLNPPLFITLRLHRSWTLCVVALCLLGPGRIPASTMAGPEAQRRGQEIIARMVEVNRAWLIAPGKEVHTYSYTLQRAGGTQKFQITNSSKTPRARLQGMTYSALLHHLARAPQSAEILAVTEEGTTARLALKFKPELRCAIGNGVENSWNGYHSFGGGEGVLVIETQRGVPLESQLGRLHETFGEFAEVDPGHLAPLKIHLEIGETAYDWRFRVYAPGLWLFDDSFSGTRRLAWVEDVRVNDASPKVVHATESSRALAAAAQVGIDRVDEFLKANAQWLLPSLETRRGLVYEYRQEEPYLERVVFDPQGNVLVRLESSKESPGKATRQRLIMADGRSYIGDTTNRFIKMEPAPAVEPKRKNPSARDGLITQFATGLALECALTRLARDTGQFWAEVHVTPKTPARYTLVLRPKTDARLFTGTMLAFTSWAYMHDVSYARAEILCEAATHRPIEEKDFDEKNKLVGNYRFEQWLADPSGPAPGLIRATVPHEDKGKDQSLEMEAQFQFARPGLWLLKQVQSKFRGGDNGSTGTVRLVDDGATAYAEIAELNQRAEATAQLLAGLEGAADIAEVKLEGREWRPLLLKASWTDSARESLATRREEKPLSALIGLCRARIIEQSEKEVAVELEGLSTAAWKEFRSNWKVTLADDQGGVIATAATNMNVRAEGVPSPFTAMLKIPLTDGASTARPLRLRVDGTIERMTGMYHGHGMWMHLAEK